jgi:hypothetical protein
MRHRRLVGYVKVQEIAGQGMPRIEKCVSCGGCAPYNKVYPGGTRTWIG